jgi:hypothetical protein
VRIRQAAGMPDPEPLSIFDACTRAAPVETERADRGLPRFLLERRRRPMTTLTLSRALNEGLRKAMEATPRS